MNLIAVIVLANAVQMSDHVSFVVAAFSYLSLPNATVIADSHDPWTCKQKHLQTVQTHHDTTSRMDSSAYVAECLTGISCCICGNLIASSAL